MKLYLSRLILNPRSRQVQTELAHPYEMHRTLMRAFPSAANGAESRARERFGVLFRPDLDERRRLLKVYVQSLVPPDWSYLDGLGDYLHPGAGLPAYECSDDIVPKLRKLKCGQVLSFRLRANPTKRVARDGDALKGKRVELQREDEQLDWLARKGREREKGVPGGFELLANTGMDPEGNEVEIPRVNVRREGKQTGRKTEASRGHVMTHLAVVFEGLLRVTDPEAFLNTLARGIGSGKAYGFGLLSVAPARE